MFPFRTPFQKQLIKPETGPLRRSIAFVHKFVLPQQIPIFRGPVIDNRIQVRPGIEFAVPVRQCGEGCDNESGSAAVEGPQQNVDGRGRLQRLAESHFVAESARALVTEIGNHPRDAFGLVIAQLTTIVVDTFLECGLVRFDLFFAQRFAERALVAKESIQAFVFVFALIQDTFAVLFGGFVVASQKCLDLRLVFNLVQDQIAFKFVRCVGIAQVSPLDE